MWHGTQGFPIGGPEGEDPGNRRPRKKARVNSWATGLYQSNWTVQWREPPEVKEQEVSDSTEPDSRRAFWPGSDVTFGIPGQAQGAALQTCGAQSLFAGHFPASSLEHSALIGIDLGRTFVRIGRR